MKELQELMAYAEGLKTGVDWNDRAGCSSWYEGFLFAVDHILEKGGEIRDRDKLKVTLNNEGISWENGTGSKIVPLGDIR